MYDLDVDIDCKKKFFKLARKNPKQLEIIDKKILEICSNPFHFKSLRGNMKGSYRVHIDTHFVLVYEIDGDIVRVLDFDHHNYIYK